MNTDSLREIADDGELELMREWRNAPQVRANMYTRHVISPEEHRQWWDRIRVSDRHCYRIFVRDGVPLGIVGFYDIDRESQHAVWAFYAAPDAPRGTGSAMEFAALDMAFGELGLRKLSCEVLEFNAAVIKLHHKFGFKTEGIFVQHHKTDTGHVDVHRLAIFADDWAQHRSDMEIRLNKTSGQ